MKDYTHNPLRGKDYSYAPATESYAEPTAEQQAENLKQAQAKGRNTRRIKNV